MYDFTSAVFINVYEANGICYVLDVGIVVSEFVATTLVFSGTHE